MRGVRNSSINSSRINLGFLNLVVSTCLFHSISPNTRKKYSSGFNQYKKFCLEIGASPFPLVESVLVLFVASISQRVSHKTIKVYLSGVQFESVIRGFVEKISLMGRLFYVIRGVRRMQGSQFVRHRRLPITPSHLNEIIKFVDRSCFSVHDKLMWKAVVCLHFLV